MYDFPILSFRSGQETEGYAPRQMWIHLTENARGGKHVTGRSERHLTLREQDSLSVVSTRYFII